MKLTTLILILLFKCSINAQKDKPHYYFDETERSISKELFSEKVNKSSIFDSYFFTYENDSCYYSIIVRRKNHGQLRKFQFDSLQNSLTDIAARPSNKYTIIQYHPGADKCNEAKARVMPDKKVIMKQPYLKKINKISGVRNYWVHKNDKKVKYKKSKLVNWQQDKNQIVEKLFFKHHYPCHSFVIINNDTKNFISFFGEYHSSQIVDFLKEMEDYN